MDGRRQRVIGMLGGMSWESSAEYYRLVNEVVRERLGGLHSARCVLASVDFADIEELQVAGRWDEAGRAAGRGGGQGWRPRAPDLLLLCTNTMHKVADQVQAAIDIPLLHIADVAARCGHRTPACSTVGLLGTAFTMEQDFYRDRLAGQRTRPCSSRRRRTAPRCTGSSMTSCAWASCGTSHARCYRAVIDRLVAAGAQGSDPRAAPRSSC